MDHPPLSATPLAAALALAFCQLAHAQPKFTPEDIGQSVNGYQDDFTGAMRDPNWVPVPPELDFYEQANGLLRVTVVGEALDTHLLYQAPGYSDTVQEVLARIRVTAFGLGDAPRCGISVAVNAETSQGINLHFRDHDQDGVIGRQFKLLDDRRAWGPRGLDLKWEDNTWYWVRLRQIGPGTGTTNNIQGKVWLGDGSVPEPSDWQMNWRRSGRTGFAGIVGSSIGGLSEFEVDYILVKAEGLPSIKAGLAAFPTPLFLSIKRHPQNAGADVGKTVTFTVEAAGSSSPNYQWQRAAPGSTNFTDIAGATGQAYTTPPLTRADNGAKFRALASLPGASVASKEAALTVDVTAPTILRAFAGVDRVIDVVTVVFSEQVTPTTATNTSNYSIPGLAISAARLGSSGTNAILRTTPLTPGTTYRVTVSGIEDPVGNRIQASTEAAITLPSEVPNDFGKTVTGFQDDFIGANRDPNWIPAPLEKDDYHQTNGLLRVTVVGEGPDTHLLYQAPAYDDAVQEVLARIRVTAFGTGDPPRCGISIGVNAETSQGINLHFRDNDQDGVLGRQFKLLDDRRAWGPPGLDIDWEDHTWYWLRLRQTTSIVTDGPNIHAKVWLADGTVREPEDWQLAWSRSDRVGFAGIVGSSVGGLSEFEVDYILIKATGLPAIKAGASAFETRAVAAPRLGIGRSAGGLTLSWVGGGTLEAADRVSGPWTPVSGAASPHAVALSAEAKFYRLRQ